MLDYYSYYPSPSKEDAIEEVVKAIIHYKSDVDENRVRDITSDIINKIPCLGSYTGWYATVKIDVVKNVKRNMEI
jgi:hypothetical protein